MSLRKKSIIAIFLGMAGKRNSGRIRKFVYCVQIFTVQRQTVRVRWFTGAIIKQCCKESERGFT